MFGYVKPYKPECKIREYEYYRGIYCGLCRALGRCGGNCARLTLTYDFTFLALVRMAIVGETPHFTRRRCLVHPLKRHTEAKTSDSLLTLADASLLLARGKLLDDIADEKGARRARARLLRPAFDGFCRRSRRRLRELDSRITEWLLALSELEKNPPLSVDRPAEMFGDMMAEILAFGLEGQEQTLAKTIGIALGKWVYLVDAIDDREADAEKGRFNPLNLVYGSAPFSDETKEELEVTLINLLADAERAFDLLQYPDDDMRGVIENHIYLGMPRTVREILSKKETPTHV